MCTSDYRRVIGVGSLTTDAMSETAIARMLLKTASTKLIIRRPSIS